MLQPTNERALWCELNRMCCAHHLLHARRRLSQGQLTRIVGQVIKSEQGALHLCRGIRLQDVDRDATALRLHKLHTALLELIADCHHRICIFWASGRARRESKLTNCSLQLLPGDAMRIDAECGERTGASRLVVCVGRVVPSGGDSCSINGARGRLMIHCGYCPRHTAADPSASWSPTARGSSRHDSRIKDWHHRSCGSTRNRCRRIAQLIK